MSSSDGVSTGLVLDVVRPAHLSLPLRFGTVGDVVADLVGMFGLVLDGAQQLALDGLCSVSSEEPFRWAALEGAVIEPRQNGKSVGVLMPLALYVALKSDDQLVVWSAHRYKTSREAFLALLKLHRRSAALRAKVARVVYSNGEESFEFKNGSRIIFVARSQASGRGLSGDLVILDEALFLTAEMMGALFPTLSARENPMVLYASSAGISTSEVLRSIRDRGRTGEDPSLVYVEWCAPEGCESNRCAHALGEVGCAADDPERWRAANPSDRVTLEYIAAERRSAMPAAEFVRERLGWWDEPGAHTRVISAAQVGLAQDDASEIVGPFVMSVDTDPERTMTAIGVCGARADGLAHIEVAAHLPGTDWVVPALLREHAKAPLTVVLDPAGAAATFVKPLEDAGVVVYQVTAREMAAACGLIYDAFMAAPMDADGEPAGLRHRGQAPLEIALAGALKRVLSAAWAWDRRDWSVDLTTLVSVTLAYWCWLVHPPEEDYDLLDSFK